MLDVAIYDAAGRRVSEFDDVDYVSLVSPETYGPPALIAPAKPGQTRAAVGDRVLYINTRLVPMFEIERTTP